MPPFRFILNPSNFLSRMKLTTPDTASEPQERWRRRSQHRRAEAASRELADIDHALRRRRDDALAIDQNQISLGAEAAMSSADRPLTPLELPPLPTVVPVLPIREGSW